MRKLDCLLVGIALWLSAATRLQAIADRSKVEFVAIPESVHSLARTENDLGTPAPDTWMDGLTIMLRPRAGTEDDLETILLEQQRRGSPAYHRWLTPDEYGKRFGVSDEDLFALIGWLEGKGVRVSEPP